MKPMLARLAGLTLGALAAMPASAIEFTLGGATARMTNKLSLGVAVRLEDREDELVGIANGGTAFSTNYDDGNLAWDRWDVVSGVTKLTSDLAISKGDFGAFVRVSGLYNPVLDNAPLFDPVNYNPSTPVREFNQDARIAKEDAVRHHVGLDADLLDAYVYGRFDAPGDRSLSVKLGRQVLNWGESLFVQHGLNALVAADVNQLRVPGFEPEEVQIPVSMAVVSLDLVENVSTELFYQFEWHRTVIDASGTFLSSNDFAGVGGNQVNLGFGRAVENQTSATNCLPPPGAGTPCVPFGSTVPRGADVEASHDGQYGGKLSIYVPALNNADVGLYAANYHSRLPLFSGTSRSGPTSPADDSDYFVEYPEDIQLYGASFNTTLPALDVALQGEYSLKVGQPLQLEDVELLLAGLGAAGQISPLPGATLGHQYIRGWRRHDVSQLDLAFTKILGPRFGYDQLSLLVESAYVYVHNLPSPEVMAYDAPGTYTLNPGTAALNPATAFGLPVTPYGAYATPGSWGYKVATRFTFNNVMGLFTMEPTLLFQHDVNGITPTPIVNFIEDRMQLNAILGINYLQTWQLDLGYASYFGAGAQNLVSDRDYLDLALKYSF